MMTVLAGVHGRRGNAALPFDPKILQPPSYARRKMTTTYISRRAILPIPVYDFKPEASLKGTRYECWMLEPFQCFSRQQAEVILHDQKSKRHHTNQGRIRIGIAEADNVWNITLPTGLLIGTLTRATWRVINNPSNWIREYTYDGELNPS